MVVFNDGTNVVDVTTYASSLVLGGALTGTTATFSGAISSVSPAFTGTPTAPTAAANTNTTQIATTAFVLANGVPTGALMMWGTNSAPTGWLICDGSSVSTSAYAALYGVIGYTFGGSGGNFLLPNYNNRFPVGSGDSYVMGATGGAANAIVVTHTHSITDPGHAHTINTNLAKTDLVGGGGNLIYTRQPGTDTTATATTGITIASAGDSGVNANLPPYIGIRFIIKT
jgi:microcystin-dependent protein